jgi:hypothetical protein
MEKYGFVYIWFDRKHKRFYIGSHWGTEDDGYICGSAWMHRSKKNRPHDFRRKIIERNIERKNLIWTERCWLWFITPEELGKRYYNLNREPMKHWHIDEHSRLSVGKKVSIALMDKKHTKERKKNMSASWTLEKREKYRRAAIEQWQAEKHTINCLKGEFRTENQKKVLNEKRSPAFSQTIKKTWTKERRAAQAEIARKRFTKRILP